MLSGRSRDDDPVPRAQTTNNEQRPDSGNPDFPNVAPAPQTWFRHTTFLMPKLSQTLNYATSRPQVSFAVVTWGLGGVHSRVSNFANTISRHSRKGHPKLENMCEAPRGQMARDDRRSDQPANAMAYCISKRHTCWIFSFYC